MSDVEPEVPEEEEVPLTGDKGIEGGGVVYPNPETVEGTPPDYGDEPEEA